MKIVYESNTGHTKKYAEMLAKKLNLPCESLKEYKEDYKEVIYLGWVMAGMRKGYSKIKNKAKLTMVIGVGLMPDKEEELIKNNNITCKFYFLPGGVDYSKLKWFKKNLLKAVGKSFEQQGNKELALLIQNGGSLADEKHLTEIVKYIDTLKGEK